MSALRLEGMTEPTGFDGPMTGRVFLAYVRQNFAPTLTAGNAAVMDNLAAHHVAGVGEAIAAKGACLM